MMPKWKALFLHVTAEHLGLIPSMLDNEDPRPAREQLDTGYAHGGGWQPFDGFKINHNGTLSYPGDPLIWPLAETFLRDERIVLYEYEWVAIFQPDGTCEISRMD